MKNLNLNHTAPLMFLILFGCTQEKINETTSTIVDLCAEVSPLANTVALIPGIPASVAAYGRVACDTAAGLEKLQSNPTSVAWLLKLKGQLKSYLKPKSEI